MPGRRQQGPPGGAPPAYPGPLPGYPYNAGHHQNVQHFPQPYPQYPVPPQPHVTQPVAQVMLLRERPLEEVPGRTTCPHCLQSVVTKVKYKSGGYTWSICFPLVFFFCCCLCWIPFCMKSTKDVHHYCPYCDKVIYVFKRGGNRKSTSC